MTHNNLHMEVRNYVDEKNVQGLSDIISKTLGTIDQMEIQQLKEQLKSYVVADLMSMSRLLYAHDSEFIFNMNLKPAQQQDDARISDRGPTDQNQEVAAQKDD